MKNMSKHNSFPDLKTAVFGCLLRKIPCLPQGQRQGKNPAKTLSDLTIASLPNRSYYRGRPYKQGGMP